MRVNAARQPESPGLTSTPQTSQHDQWLREMERAWLQSWIQQSAPRADPDRTEVHSGPGSDPKPVASTASPRDVGAPVNAPLMVRRPGIDPSARQAITTLQTVIDRPGLPVGQGQQQNPAQRAAMPELAQRPAHEAGASLLSPPPWAEALQFPSLGLNQATQSVRPSAVPLPEAARASRIPAPAPSQAAPPPGALHLREPHEGAVQASLCAPWMGEYASRQAAEGLAYALMQAGYLRAQVYVNGNRQVRQREADPGTVPNPPVARSAAPAPITSLNPAPESSHGH